MNIYTISFLITSVTIFYFDYSFNAIEVGNNLLNQVNSACLGLKPYGHPHCWR